MRTLRPRRLFAALAILLGSCGETVEVSQADPFVPSAGPAQGKGDDGWEFSYRESPSRAEGKPRLDLRALNEPIAGQSGFVGLSGDGNSFMLGSGAPARFWAINSEVFRQSPEAIDQNVRFLARVGVNMVRLHAQITPKGPGSKPSEVDEKEIDGIWRYVAAAKAQGIYTTISPYWANSVDAAKWKIEGYGSGELYGLLFFEEALQAAYKGWTKALLTRKNPYTGVPLFNEPAVAILQIQNEDSLLFWTADQMKPPARAKLARKFAAWAVTKYGSVDSALKAWDNAKLPGDAPIEGRLALIDLYQLAQRQAGGSGRRAGDQLAFVAELQRSFYEGMAAYFKGELGCRQLINASNWRTADDVRLDAAERWSYSGVEVIAANRYYNGGVHLGPNAGWRIDPGDKFSQKSALVDPRAMPFNLKQVVGHPMIISESTWVAPLAFAAEGPFLASVYPSLTGVDAFFWFTDAHPEYDLNPFFPYAKVKGQEPLTKWTAMTPTILGGFPAASILFRGGYIKPGTPAVHEERSLVSIWNRDDPILAEGPAFDPNRDPGVAPNGPLRRSISTGVDPLAFLVGPVEVRFEGNPSQTRIAAEVPRLIDRARKTVRSITGEITLDYGKGLCLVDAPKAQGACGFLNQAGPIKLKDLAIDSANPFASILAVSLDDEPLATNHRTLVQVTTAARPTGWATLDAEFTEIPGKPPKLRGFEITQTGKPPWRVAETKVGLALKNPNLTKATRLDPAGFAVEDVPVTKTKTGLTLTLPPETMYLILE